MNRREMLIRTGGGAAALAAGAGFASAQTVLRVAAVSYPLAYFTARIGGDAVEVIFPVPTGADPEVWRPAVPDIVAIQGADLILLSGGGFAGWTAKASLPRGRLVDTSAGYADRFIKTQSLTHSHGNDGAHSHAATATYTWLDFDLAAQQAAAVAEALVRKAPGLEREIDTNLNDLTGDLAVLQARITALSDRLQSGGDGRRIIAAHPRYQYLARGLGVEIASLEWAAGAEPSAEDWAALDALATGAEAPILLWEATPPEAAAAQLAARGITGVVFAPLASPPAQGDFLSEMAAALDALEVALAG